MPSTYTTNGGLEKPGDGEQSGDWGDTVNINMDIIDVITNGQVTLSLSGTSSTLSTSNAVVSDGQNALLILGGTPSGTHTITIDPSDAEKIYLVYNTTAQSVVFTQGSGGNVTIATGDSAVIYANGGGASAAVANLTDHFAMSSVKVTGGAINGTPIGATSASTGAFSTLSASSTTTLSGQLGLGGANYGTAGQVVVSQGAGSAPAWGSGFPSGGIILWSGSVASIPSGWLLCNGSSGTPDLRDRFVVGAGSTYAVGATGGAASVTLSTAEIPSHTHTFSGTTDTVGDHTHTINISYSPDFDYYGNNVTGLNAGQNGANSVTGQSVNLTTAGAGNHSHTVSGTTGAAGSGGSHENRPPYYALAYIMKS